MNYEYGPKHQLTRGSIQFLNSYKFEDSKKNLFVNFTFQIYDSTPLINSNLFSCCLFDKNNISNNFILKYKENEGKPFKGDIISVTKINISVLIDHKLFICEEVNLLEKNKKFLIVFYLQLNKIIIFLL